MTHSLLAHKFSDALGCPFLETYRHQYVLSETQVDIPEFEHHRLGGLHLYHHPDLPIAKLTAKDGTQIGWALGYAITPKGVLLRGSVRLTVDTQDADSFSKLENVVHQFSGRYVIILNCDVDGKRFSRLYHDPIGALGAIYDPKSRICASTLLLTLNRDIDPHPLFKVPNEIRGIPELSDLLPPPDDGDQLYVTCFGESFDRHARQLLTNHYLDLASFTSHRAVIPAPKPELSSVNAAADIIVERLHSNLSAIQPHHNGYLAISGGLDSRMVIASLPDTFHEAFPFYCYSDNWVTGVDLRLAHQLAAKCNAPLIAHVPPNGPGSSFFPKPRRAAFFQKRCAIASGLKTAGDAWWRNGYFRQLETGKLWVRGNALEVVTARLWTPTVDVPLRKAMRHAIRRLGLLSENRDTTKYTQDAFLAWRDTLPEHALDVMPDFWYQELFLSHSQTQFHGLNDQAYFPPASDNALLEAARAVPAGDRSVHALYQAIMRRAKPELDAIPNTRDILAKIKQTGAPLDDFLPPVSATLGHSETEVLV